ncbi:MAG: molybdopterin-binding protein, partial [Chloroflexi bacterium]|nr:molybdopterin-binding protein [Chloroflexota bacterium]
MDEWIKSACNMCFSSCGIKVHRVDGVVVKIEGDLDNPLSQGRLCAKGLAGMMSLYDPYRLKVPLKRTNPRKGRGEDPRWVEITWDEALDT